MAGHVMVNTIPDLATNPRELTGDISQTTCYFVPDNRSCTVQYNITQHYYMSISTFEHSHAIQNSVKWNEAQLRKVCRVPSRSD